MYFLREKVRDSNVQKVQLTLSTISSNCKMHFFQTKTKLLPIRLRTTPSVFTFFMRSYSNKMMLFKQFSNTVTYSPLFAFLLQTKGTKGENAIRILRHPTLIRSCSIFLGLPVNMKKLTYDVDEQMLFWPVSQ